MSRLWLTILFLLFLGETLHAQPSGTTLAQNMLARSLARMRSGDCPKWTQQECEEMNCSSFIIDLKKLCNMREIAESTLERNFFDDMTVYRSKSLICDIGELSSYSDSMRSEDEYLMNLKMNTLQRDASRLGKIITVKAPFKIRASSRAEKLSRIQTTILEGMSRKLEGIKEARSKVTSLEDKIKDIKSRSRISNEFGYDEILSPEAKRDVATLQSQISEYKEQEAAIWLTVWRGNTSETRSYLEARIKSGNYQIDAQDFQSRVIDPMIKRQQQDFSKSSAAFSTRVQNGDYERSYKTQLTEAGWHQVYNQYMNTQLGERERRVSQLNQKYLMCSIEKDYVVGQQMLEWAGYSVFDVISFFGPLGRAAGIVGTAYMASKGCVAQQGSLMYNKHEIDPEACNYQTDVNRVRKVDCAVASAATSIPFALLLRKAILKK